MYDMYTYNALIVLVGSALLGLTCGTIGCFTVLRGRALLGDVIAHASLPGIALAFWLTQVKSLPILLTGALCTGLMGSWIIAFLSKNTRTKEDAAMGLVLSILFGAGVALSRHIQNAIPEGSKAGLDTYILGKTAGIVFSDVVMIAAICVLILLSILLFLKQFHLIIFDPGYASSLGWKTLWFDFWIMGLLVLVIVAALPMVGVVMSAAMVILPVVTARFWTYHFLKMVGLAGLFGVLGAVVGVWISAQQKQMPTGPTMILILGALFVFSACFAPQKGLLSSWVKHLRYSFDTGLRLFILELDQQDPLTFSQGIQKIRDMGIAFPRLILVWGVRTGRLEYGERLVRVTEKGRSFLKEKI